MSHSESVSTGPSSLPRTLSIIIPVYNSASILPETIQRLVNVLSGIGEEFETILVDDGSRDGSWQVIEALAAKHPELRGIRLARNYGQHNALVCGIREARHEVVVTLDDDLQHPPEEIPKLLTELEKGHDVVYGTPGRERHQGWRVLASWITKLALQQTMGAKAARSISAFRAFRREVAGAFGDYSDPYANVDVLLAWGAASYGEVPTRHDERRDGCSHYTFRMLVRHGINLLTGFSNLPLRVASLMGFAMAAFGLGVLGYVVGRYLVEGGGVPGFPFLASIIAIFSGAQLLTLGILGEYLARVHFRSMNRPVYLVRQRTHTESESEPSDADFDRRRQDAAT